MTTKTVANPSTDALDLRPALELRTESAQLIARMQAGESGPELIARAEALLGRESDLVEAAEAALVAFGDADSQPAVVDQPVYDVVNALATGQLSAWLEWLSNRPEVAS